MWAMFQNALGVDYSARIRGDRAENLKLAISFYQAALEVRTREAFPEDWAMTQMNLGNAYGDAGQFSEAIAAYQAALEVSTREAFPEDWAMTQMNLGVAYNDSGQQSEAIAAYQAALEVRTREAFPEDWAMTQNNLGEDVGLKANTLRSSLSDGILDVLETPESSDTHPPADSTSSEKPSSLKLRFPTRAGGRRTPLSLQERGRGRGQPNQTIETVPPTSTRFMPSDCVRSWIIYRKNSMKSSMKS
jgi:tetratricopeptide (TPR) repeat protein